MNVRLLFLHALSPIHCGTGQAIGGIDLPIAREKPTNIPLVPGSSLKGTLRARSKPDDGGMQTTVFGPDTEHASDHAGSVQFSDANLVFLPVRSVCGTFAWVTSPYLLRRLVRDAAETGQSALATATIPQPKSVNTAGVTSDKLKAGNKVVFEDLDFEPAKDPLVLVIAQAVAQCVFAEADREFFTERVCVVHDDVMSVLLRTSMELVARNRLNPETKTVEGGALWTEEALPIESILAGVVVATPVPPKRGARAPDAEKLLEYIEELAARTLQIGGKATVGRGLCRITVKR